MISRTVPLGRVFAPALAEVLNGSIVGDAERIMRKTAPDLLERFRYIAEAPDTDAAVVNFAKRWGMLSLCEHGLPCGHRMPRCKPSTSESFNDWKKLAVFFESMCRIGIELNRGRCGEKTDWQVAADYFPSHRWVQGSHGDVDVLGRKSEERFLDVGISTPEFIATLKSELNQSQEGILDLKISTSQLVATLKSTDVARMLYMFFMQELIKESGLQPRFYWGGGMWNIDLDSEACSNIPAILTAQLMLRVGSSKTMVKCSECPRWFLPRRNQRKYCNHCGKRAMWRVAQRKRKGKIDEQKKTRKR